MAIPSEVAGLRASLAQIGQRYRFSEEQCAQINRRLREIEADKAELVKAVALIDRAIATISANGIGKIENIVSAGMRLAFDDPTLGFKVVKNENERGNKYKLEGMRGEVQGPFLDTFGGGIWNVVAFLLRIIMVKRFKLAKVLIADEAFNNVAVRFQPQVSRLLRSLAQDHGYTILAITHQPILAASADYIYQVVPTTPGQSPTLKKLSAGDLSGVFPSEE